MHWITGRCAAILISVTGWTDEFDDDVAVVRRQLRKASKRFRRLIDTGPLGSYAIREAADRARAASEVADEFVAKWCAGEAEVTPTQDGVAIAGRTPAGEQRVRGVVRARMLERGLRNAALAREAGVDPGTVGDFINGTRWPYAPALARVERALGFEDGGLSRLASGQQPPIAPEATRRVGDGGVVVRPDLDPSAIRAARERRGWSQQQLAHAVGVSTRTVGNWERGETLTPDGRPGSAMCSALRMVHPTWEIRWPAYRTLRCSRTSCAVQSLGAKRQRPDLSQSEYPADSWLA